MPWCLKWCKSLLSFRFENADSENQVPVVKSEIGIQNCLNMEVIVDEMRDPEDINRVFMDYTPPYYRQDFGWEKITIFKRAEKLKNGVLGPPQAKNFGSQTHYGLYPPYSRQISNKGGIVHKDSIDLATKRLRCSPLCGYWAGGVLENHSENAFPVLTQPDKQHDVDSLRHWTTNLKAFNESQGNWLNGTG